MSRHWFSPPLLGLHALAVLALAVCVTGGLWQLGVYEGRQSAEASRPQASAPITQEWSAGESFPRRLLHQEVTATGRFGPADEQFWVQGELTTDGAAWLVAPFEVDGSDASLLVVRGRADRPGDLAPVPAGDRTLRLSLAPSDAATTPLDAQRVTGSISVPALLNELPVRLWSGYGIALQDTGADLPLVPAPDPDVPWTVGLRNLAYTLQWWVFGLFAGFMWWRMASETVQARRSRESADDPASSLAS